MATTPKYAQSLPESTRREQVAKFVQHMQEHYGGSSFDLILVEFDSRREMEFEVNQQLRMWLHIVTMEAELDPPYSSHTYGTVDGRAGSFALLGNYAEHLRLFPHYLTSKLNWAYNGFHLHRVSESGTLLVASLMWQKNQSNQMLILLWYQIHSPWNSTRKLCRWINCALTVETPRSTDSPTLPARNIHNQYYDQTYFY